jgi:hypothetical protein
MSRAVRCTLVCAAWALFGVRAAPAQDVYLKETRLFNTEKSEALSAALAAEEPPTDAQVQAAEICARHHVYRLTDPKYRDPKTPAGSMNRLVEQCNHWLSQAFKSKEKRNPQMQVVFRNKMLEAIDNALKPEDQSPLAQVNVTRVLARLAKDSGHVETANLLLKVLSERKKGLPDPKYVDGARYWALKGLKDLLLNESQKPPMAARMDPKLREQIAEALVAFIERKPALEKNAPQEELEGLRMMRREAVRALALIPEPLFAGNPKAHTALTLLRVLRKDKELVPEPRLDEQLEAAVGLARLRADAKNDYQPGYAAYHLAHFLKEFGERFNNRSTTDRAGQREPWKVHGARLHDAFRAMQTAFPNDPAVKGVAPVGLALGQALEKKPEAAGDAIRDANTWLTGNPRPPVASLYKSDENAVVTPRAAEAP